MKHIVAIGFLLALAACGVDGAPITPSVNTGVRIDSKGTHPNVSVGARKGPLSVHWDLL